jgi:hypothetical protein
MYHLRMIARALFLLPVFTLIYDLVDGWFVHATLDIRSLEEWGLWLGKDKWMAFSGLMDSLLPAGAWKDYAALASPVALLIPPILLYIAYRILFYIKGGRGSRAYIYKSHD